MIVAVADAAAAADAVAADAVAADAAPSLMPPLQVPWRRCVQFINYQEIVVVPVILLICLLF